jgi:hypothetical protein
MGKNAADSPEEKLAQGRKIASGAGGAFSRWLGSSNKEDGYDKMIEAGLFSTTSSYFSSTLNSHP